MHSQDAPLVLHMPNSWQPAAQPVTFPHASAEVGLGLDLNGQSSVQKMNSLPLCQGPSHVHRPLRDTCYFWSCKLQSFERWLVIYFISKPGVAQVFSREINAPILNFW